MKKAKFSPRVRAISQAIFVTVLWSSSWVLIKIGLRNDLPAITFAGLRYSLAFLLLSLFVLFSPAQRQELRHLSVRDWGKFALLGIVFYSLTQGAMFLTLAFLPANMLSLLLNLTAVFVGIAGVFILKERPSLLQWIGISLATFGVGIYFIPNIFQKVPVLGIGIGLFCMIMNVLSSLFSRDVNRSGRYSSLIVTFVPMGIGAGVMLVIGLLTQGIGRLTTLDWFIIIWLAFINTAFTFWLWNRSLQVLTAVESAIINSLMLPQIAILAFIFLGEGMSAREVVGMVIVGVGTIIVQLKPNKNR